MAAHRPPNVLAVSNTIYSLLLRACPAGYRHAYGRLMLQAFCDLAREARYSAGWQGLLRLWLRTLPDLAVTAVHEHLAALAQGGAIVMENRPCTPLPWWQVGLAIVPGLLVTAGGLLRSGLLSWLTSGRSLGLLVISLVALPVGAALVCRRRFPLWALTALGLLFGLGAVGPYFLLLGLPGALAAVAYLIIRKRQRRDLPAWAWAILALSLSLSFLLPLLAALGLPSLPRLPTLDPSLFSTVNWWPFLGIGATLLVALLALPLARQCGLPVGLLLLGAGFALWEQTFDLTYGLASTFWGNTMLAILEGLLLVAAPLWVLRARSLHGQARGLLIPAALALACAVAICTIVRTDPAILEGLLGRRALVGDLQAGIGYGTSGPAMLAPLLLRDGLTVLQLLLALVLAVVLYARAQTAEAP